MFSKTMMALSTNIPTASASPAIDKTLSVMPAWSMTAKVAMTDKGIAVETIMALRKLRRKPRRTRKVISTPSMAVEDRLPRERLMNSA